MERPGTPWALKKQVLRPKPELRSWWWRWTLLPLIWLFELFWTICSVFRTWHATVFHVLKYESSVPFSTSLYSSLDQPSYPIKYHWELVWTDRLCVNIFVTKLSAVRHVTRSADSLTMSPVSFNNTCVVFDSISVCFHPLNLLNCFTRPSSATYWITFSHSISFLLGTRTFILSLL
jgi:hypothetical protein